MAGGLSAGSVRDTRRPRHVLPGRVTSLGGAALRPRPRVQRSRPRPAQTPRPGVTSYPKRPYLTGRQSGSPRSTSQQHLQGQNGACPRPSEKRSAQAPSPFRRSIRRCYGSMTPRQRRQGDCWENRVGAGSSEVRLQINIDLGPDLVCQQ